MLIETIAWRYDSVVLWFPTNGSFVSHRRSGHCPYRAPFRESLPLICDWPRSTINLANQLVCHRLRLVIQSVYLFCRARGEGERREEEEDMNCQMQRNSWAESGFSSKWHVDAMLLHDLQLLFAPKVINNLIDNYSDLNLREQCSMLGQLR